MDFNDYIELDVDYYDMERGYLFHIQDYNYQNKNGLPNKGIKVTVDGDLVGYYDPNTKTWSE